MTSLNRLKFLIAASTLFIVAAAFKGDKATVPALSEYVHFEIKNAGILIEGSFAVFNADIEYDAKAPNSSSFSGTISTASINTGIELRDEHLVKEEYFHSEKFPNITFESTYVALLTDGNLKVKGNLTIKGTTKEVQLIVTPTTEGATTYFTTELKLDRLDYNVGESSWVLSDDVKCLLRLAAN